MVEPDRYLTGWLHSERVLPYQCPSSHPWLNGQNYAPFGTLLIRGVEVDQTGPVGVSIGLPKIGAAGAKPE